MGVAIIKILSLLPFPVLYALSTAIAYILSKKSKVKDVTCRNLRRAFPEKSPKEIHKLAFKYLEAYLDFMIEFAKRIHFSEDEIKRRCRFKNMGLLYSLFKENKMIVCYAGHLVNYEWLVSFPLQCPEYGMCHLYLSPKKAHKVGKFEQWILDTRSAYGAVNVPSKYPLKTIVRLDSELKDNTSPFQGIIFGSLSDMDINLRDVHRAKFFNHDLEVFTGTERIARKMNMPFVFANITRPKRGFYEIEFCPIIPKHDISDDKYAFTDEYVHMLENNIRLQPELWMFWGAYRF